MNDIVVFSVSHADHVENVWPVLRLLYKAALMLKLKKYKFFPKTIDYLDHGIRPSYFKLAEHTTNAMTKPEHLTA